ncbi:tRNA (adenine(22)-N(1))-methyltransferase [Sediminibacillus massiliensis]|uniref:tRNA (adenine(22)-N(1))-methyltransferase n=1 Tax=Sediminibacillus massiliensis TaxID=1926277 RepID=UPI0009885FFB|nr:class I SAM-dependent methyltransferase [Sediminibacillus massiliensis]
MRENGISKRLQLVADFLPPAAKFADIGSDHAYLPVYVCSRDNQAQAIAGELNEGPYQSAKKNVQSFGLSGQIEVRKGDGLAVLNEKEVDQLVIAGMGGSLIADILNSGKNKLSSVDRIIAQPNVDAKSIRVWFQDNGYLLAGEKIIEESGHIYEILMAERKESVSPLTDKELLCGPFLLKEKSPAFVEKWKSELLKRERALTEMKKASNPDTAKMAQFSEEINLIKEVLA